MRIALVSDWYQPRRGGIETQLARLALELRSRGHVVRVVTSQPAAVADGSIELRPIGARLPGSALALNPVAWPRLRDALAGHDVVHCHASVVSPLAYAGALAARSLGVPAVVSFHSVLHLLRYALRAFPRRHDGITWTAVSSLVRRQAASALGEVAVLPNGIDLGFWRDIDRLGPMSTRASAAAASPPTRLSGSPTLIYCGRLQRKKRVAALARAFVGATSSTGIAARLVLCGDGPERERVRSIARRAAPGSIECRGWLPAEEIRALYASADLFVSACEREAFGIAALEASAAGLPVLAMRASGSSDFLDHESNAILVDDDVALEGAIADVLRDPTTLGPLTQSDDRLARYDWSSVTESHLRLYGRATSDARAVSPAERTVAIE